MSLCHYDYIDEIPSGIELVKDNEEYFTLVTQGKLDSKADWLLEHIDDGKFVDKEIWKDRWGRGLYWSLLSTGGKTILNVYYNPTVCFSCLEAGMNAHAVINSKIKNGIVLDCGFWVLGPEYANNIEICSEGIKYTNIQEYCESKDIIGYGNITEMTGKDWYR